MEIIHSIVVFCNVLFPLGAIVLAFLAYHYQRKAKDYFEDSDPRFGKMQMNALMCVVMAVVVLAADNLGRVTFAQ